MRKAVDDASETVGHTVTGITEGLAHGTQVALGIEKREVVVTKDVSPQALTAKGMEVAAKLGEKTGASEYIHGHSEK